MIATDRHAWRLEAEFRIADPRQATWRRALRLRRLARQTRRALPGSFLVRVDARWLYVYADSETEIHEATRRVGALLLGVGEPARLRVDRWRSQRWQKVMGPSRAGNDHVEPHPDSLRVRWHRWRPAVYGVLILTAVGGITFYALDPGVLSYNVSWLLLLPALGVGLFWAGRTVPRRWQWPLAWVLAPTGPLAYVLLGGAQWWSWGRLTVAPLVALVAVRGVRVRRGTPPPSWYGGMKDGPWGPP